ncbi:MAG: uridine diphosphate-N-acetylglucosamine-binding protein YvcK, partial [Armatimonadetes bacterium]|nr:uridine diphosphate-N-acetylglucosamine-binding protein YvcK [Armatimonadota bacterium]
MRILAPGLRVKRWLVLAIIGLAGVCMGITILVGIRWLRRTRHAATDLPGFTTLSHLRIQPQSAGILLTTVGILLFLVSIWRFTTAIVAAIRPDMKGDKLLSALSEQSRLSRGRRIVVIGGGTGLSTMLRGLKRFSSNIIAIVTVSDDGGSSGRLRKQLNILPPGDIRNCLVALADAEDQMTRLLQYRFGNTDMRAGAAAGARNVGDGLRDHSFGNLLIAAMCAINGGDFERAVAETSRVLNIRGRVIPSTADAVKLQAEMEDGSVIEGETTIAGSPLAIKRMSIMPNDTCPLPEVLEAIESADVIVLGPGSVFTSVLPNLLLHGMAEALHRSSAVKVYVCNVMTQPGETDRFTASDHVDAIERHCGLKVCNVVLVNNGQPRANLLDKYRQTGSILVEPDADRIRARGYRTVVGNYISQTDVVRHD